MKSRTKTSETASDELGRRALISRITRRDETAMAAFYDQTSHIVHGYVSQIVGEPGAAEEVTLDVYLDVWSKSGKYDSKRGTVMGWTLGMARCRAIDRVRHRQRTKRSGNLPETLTEDRTGSNPEQSVSANEQRTVILRALETLSPSQKEAIELGFWSDLTHQEIAKIVKKPLGTVKSSIRKGMLKLEEELAGFATNRQSGRNNGQRKEKST